MLGYMPNGEPALLQLRMALYGLRQSAREWAITLRDWLLAWRSHRLRAFADSFDASRYHAQVLFVLHRRAKGRARRPSARPRRRDDRRAEEGARERRGEKP